MKFYWLTLLTAVALAAGAQERVVPAADPDALFHSSDPKLDANKQVVYHIFKDLLETSHVELADKYLTAGYVQHNPNIASGRDGLTEMLKRDHNPPLPMTARLTKFKPVSVVAEGDMVVVTYLAEGPDPSHPGKTFTTTAFDMFRIKDGKADEHWDPVTPRGAPYPPPPTLNLKLAK